MWSQEESIIIPATIKDENGVEWKVTEFNVSEGEYTSISLPSTIQYITGNAFNELNNRNSLNLKLNNNSIVESKERIIYSNKSRSGDNVRTLCNTQMRVISGHYIVPDDVMSIGEEAFLDQNAMTSIELPKSIKNIGFNAFKGCLNLKEIIVHNIEGSIVYWDGEDDFEEEMVLTKAIGKIPVKFLGDTETTQNKDIVENNDSYLVNITKKDIIAFMQNNQKLLFNERDFQMHLAVWLRESKHYDDVEVEYYIPYEELDNYIWKKELRLDIVVRKEKEYLPIELKYKTKHVAKEILRFGEKIADVEVLKDQGAKDLGMYDFWKDVRRIELVRKRFPTIMNGLAVFVTNDDSYLRPSRNTSNNHLLSLNEGPHGTEKHWQQTNSVCAQTHPNFEVDKCYDISWTEVKLNFEQFYYCILVV